MNFFSRFQGVFLNPQPTFRSLSEKPVWVDALLVLLVVLALFSYVISPYLQKDTLQTAKNNIKLQERLGKENYNKYIVRLENPSKVGTLLQSFLLSPLTSLIGLLLASLVIFVIGRMTSTEGNYVQVFSAYLHANFVDKILGNAIRLILILARKSVLQTSTSLALFFPKLEVTSPGYVVLSQFDFFQIWLFGIFAYSLSAIFKFELKKALFISYGFWLLKSLLYIGLGMLALRYMG